MVKVSQVDLSQIMGEDDRGWGMNPVKAAGLTDQAVHNLHVVSLRPGVKRANHYHKEGTEWLLAFGSPTRFVWRVKDETECTEEIIQGEGPTLFEIPPFVEHVIINAGQEKDLYLVVFYDQPDPETLPSKGLTP